MSMREGVRATIWRTLNAPFLRGLLLLLMSMIFPMASTQAGLCNTKEEMINAQTQLESKLSAIKEAQRLREIEIDQVVRATASRLNWTQNDQSSFFINLMASPEFLSFEQEKQPMTAEIMRIMTSPVRSGSSEGLEYCEDVARVESIIDRVKEVNQRQYDFMSREVNAAK